MKEKLLKKGKNEGKNRVFANLLIINKLQKMWITCGKKYHKSLFISGIFRNFPI